MFIRKIQEFPRENQTNDCFSLKETTWFIYINPSFPAIASKSGNTYLANQNDRSVSRTEAWIIVHVALVCSIYLLPYVIRARMVRQSSSISALIFRWQSRTYDSRMHLWYVIRYVSLVIDTSSWRDHTNGSCDIFVKIVRWKVRKKKEKKEKKLWKSSDSNDANEIKSIKEGLEKDFLKEKKRRREGKRVKQKQIETWSIETWEGDSKKVR